MFIYDINDIVDKLSHENMNPKIIKATKIQGAKIKVLCSHIVEAEKITSRVNDTLNSGYVATLEKSRQSKNKNN